MSHHKQLPHHIHMAVSDVLQPLARVIQGDEQLLDLCLGATCRMLWKGEGKLGNSGTYN